MKILLALFFSITAVGLSAQSTRVDTLLWYFNVDEYKLSDQEIGEKAGALINRLDKQGANTIQVIAATDCSGSASHNKRLADNRCRTLTNWLSKNYPDLAITTRLIPEENCASHEEGLRPSSRRVMLIVAREVPSEERTTPPQELVEEEKVETTEEQTLEDLNTASVGSIIVMEGFQFIGGRHIPLPESMPKLEELYRVMSSNPGLHIEIAGHICCMAGEPMDGLDWDTGLENLSEARARYVREYLMSRGIEADRMTAVGYAGRLPLIHPERTEADEQKNRRVEIKITQQ